MQQFEQTGERSGAGRRRLETVAETLANLRDGGETRAEVAHDARNMVAALGLYCDLLEEPGVLAAQYRHYGIELRLVASASRNLVQKLVTMDSRGTVHQSASSDVAADADDQAWVHSAQGRRGSARLWEQMHAAPIENLAAELIASENLLAALAGPAIKLCIETDGGALPVRMTGEDLIRILVNLVKNAAEAMTGGGSVRVSLRESPTRPGTTRWLTLTIEDNGPGLPQSAIEKVFLPGFTTRAKTPGVRGYRDKPAVQRGLGLAITRSIVKAAGGRVNAANRDPSGACFQIDLPIRSR